MHVHVTERRLADESLREREREQRQLAETLTAETRRLRESQSVASLGSWETNLDTLEVVWTQETDRVYELNPAEFHPTHQRFLELVHPNDRAKVESAFVDSQGRPETFAIEQA
jgi:predicted phosphatase